MGFARVQRELNRHRNDAAGLLANPRISPRMRTRLAIVDRWVQGEPNDDDRAVLDQIRAAFDAATLAFRLDAMREELAARDGRIAALTNRLDAARRVTAESDERVATLSEAVAYRDLAFD